MRNLHNILTDVEAVVREFDLKFRLKFKNDRDGDSIYLLKIWQRNMYFPARIEFILNDREDRAVASLLRKGDLSMGVINVVQTEIMDRL